MANKPQSVEELTAIAEELKQLYAKLHKAKVNRPKRNKYENLHKQMKSQDLPVVRLNDSVFTNKSEASMQQQFNEVAEKFNEAPYSVVFTDQGNYLIDFDNERAEATFASFVEKIAEKDVVAIKNDLLYATR